MKMKIEEVFEAVKRERTKWDTSEQSNYRVRRWLNLIREEVYKAEAALEFGAKEDALREILRLVTIGVACLEQHGVVERDEE